MKWPVHADIPCVAIEDEGTAKTTGCVYDRAVCFMSVCYTVYTFYIGDNSRNEICVIAQVFCCVLEVLDIYKESCIPKW